MTVTGPFDLSVCPEPLSRRQQLVFAVATVGVAVSRLAACAATLWDWDETLFSLAVRHFDVAHHHPHPPGFPLHIALGKFVHLFVADEFRALQIPVIAFAMLLFPVTFLLAREMRFSFAASLSAAALSVFAPNVWFYGGTAFSDVPALALALLAVLLYLRGARSRPSYLVASIVFGLSCGIRIQNVLLVAAPMLLATYVRWRKNRRDAVAMFAVAVAIVGALVAVQYGLAIRATGWDRWIRAVKIHSQYIRNVDSIGASTRPPIRYVADDFLVYEFRQKVVSMLATMLAIVSLVSMFVRRRGNIALVVATFFPFALFATLILDRWSATRFSVAYVAGFALLAIDGLAIVASAGGERWQDRIVSIVSGLLVAALAVWSWPSLQVVRTTPSPVYASMHWTATHLDPRTDTLHIADALWPMGDYFLPQFTRVHASDERAPESLMGRRAAWWLHEGPAFGSEGMTWKRAELHLRQITRTRYYEVSIARLGSAIAFGDGWYGEEQSADSVWRWTGATAELILPRRGPEALLTIDVDGPADALERRPIVTITADGVIVDRFELRHQTQSRSIGLKADKPIHMVIATDETFNPARRHVSPDTRDLGVRFTRIEFDPVAASRR